MAEKIKSTRIKYVKTELGYQPPDVDFIKKLSDAFDLTPRQVWQLFFADEGSATETMQTGTNGK
jgi:transcriptional regulator with XRE-family HTH domain